MSSLDSDHRVILGSIGARALDGVLELRYPESVAYHFDRRPPVGSVPTPIAHSLAGLSDPQRLSTGLPPPGRV